MTFFCLNWRKSVFSCNRHYCNCSIWNTHVQREASLFCAYSFPKREAIGKADKSMSLFFHTGNSTTRMTAIACFIVLTHNLAEYKCQICVCYPVYQKSLADLCSYIHCILISDLYPVSFKREVVYTRTKPYQLNDSISSI